MPNGHDFRTCCSCGGLANVSEGERANEAASIMAATHGSKSVRRAQNQSIADIKAHVGPR